LRSPPYPPLPEFLGARRSKTEKMMSLDTHVVAKAPASYPLQFINIELTPLIDGRFSVALHATLLDEEQLDFIGEDLAHEHVKTLDEALALIRTNIEPLALFRIT
jgi:hypothetical protein